MCVLFVFLRKEDALTVPFLLKCKFPASEFSSIIRLNMLGNSVATDNLKMAGNNIGLFAAHAACSAWVSRGSASFLLQLKEQPQYEKQQQKNHWRVLVLQVNVLALK